MSSCFPCFSFSMIPRLTTLLSLKQYYSPSFIIWFIAKFPFFISPELCLIFIYLLFSGIHSTSLLFLRLLSSIKLILFIKTSFIHTETRYVQAMMSANSYHVPTIPAYAKTADWAAGISSAALPASARRSPLLNRLCQNRLPFAWRAPLLALLLKYR